VLLIFKIMTSITYLKSYPSADLNQSLINRNLARINPKHLPHLTDSDLQEITNAMNGVRTNKQPQKRIIGSVFKKIESPTAEKRPCLKANWNLTFSSDRTKSPAESDTENSENNPPTVRKFRCPYPGCDHSATRSDNLKLHMKKHNNERPFVCPHKILMPGGEWKQCKNHAKRQGDFQKHVLHMHYTPCLDRVDKVLKNGRQFQLKPGHFRHSGSVYASMLRDNVPFLSLMAEKINARRLAIRNAARISNDVEMLEALDRWKLLDLETPYRRGVTVEDIFGNPRVVFCDVELDLRDFNFGDRLDGVFNQ